VNNKNQQNKYIKYLKDNHSYLNLYGYTEAQVKALYELSNTINSQTLKGGGGISNNVTKQNWNNKAFWAFLSEIDISKKHPSFISDCGLNNNLSDFCKKHCHGDITRSISSLDRLWHHILDKSKEAELKQNEFQKGQLADLLAELEIITLFMRDIENFVQLSQPRKDRKASLDNGFEKHVESITNNQRQKKNTPEIGLIHELIINSRRNPPLLKPSSKNTPNQFFAGFCLLCHCPISPSDYYCSEHKKPGSSENRPDTGKTLKTVINNAFNNLGYALLHERTAVNRSSKKLVEIKNHSMRNSLNSQFEKEILKLKNEHNLSNKNLFTQKANFLLEWSRQHPKQKVFEEELKKISSQYLKPNNSNIWTKEFLAMLNQIIFFSQTQKIHLFSSTQPLLRVTEEEVKKILSIQNELLNLSLNEEVGPTIFIESIKRINQFKLIKKASKVKGLLSIKNEDHLPAHLIKQLM